MENPTDTVVEVVGDWLRAVCRREAKRAERDVDHAVWETFPASDPIAPYQAEQGGDAVQDLVMTITADGLRIARCAAPDDDAIEGPHRLIVGDTREGTSVRLEVRVDAEAVKRLPIGGALARLVRSVDPSLAAEAGRDPGEDAPKTPPEHA